MLDVYESMKRLVKVATGEEYGDYTTVMNVGVGNEQNPETIWASGNWNGELGGRLAKALERIGVELEWYDEVDTCNDCQKLIRVQPDSYMWQPGYLTMDEGSGYVCFECLDLTNDDILDEFKFVDNYNKCVPNEIGKHLEEWGWEPFNGFYEHGWHPGQTDDPHVIFDKIKEKLPKLSVVFRLDETSQFYIRFTAWVKERNQDEQVCDD